MRHRLQRLVNFIVCSPTVVVVIIGGALFCVLLARGLDIGPLQTDVIIHRAWFKELGVAGFSQRLFASNQRHILYGAIYDVLYRLWGEHDLGYHIIFQLSRVFQGVFMAGVVYQLTRRRALAVCAGLALMLTVIRVRELYQENNWFIEPTLALLLASSYTYLISLRATSRRWLWYALSLTCYVFSILIYESGLPWIGVNLFLGWIMRWEQPLRLRTWRAVRDVLPAILSAGIVLYLVLFVFSPWTGLAPDASAGSPLRVVSQLDTLLTFPSVYFHYLRDTLNDGYTPMFLLFAVIAVIIGCLSILLVHTRSPSPRTERGSPLGSDTGQVNDLSSDPKGRGEVLLSPRHAYPILLVLAFIMLLSSILVGTSNQIGQEYLDRITFGRSGGITLFYVTLIFAACSLLRGRWREIAAVGITAVVLLGPGFGWLWAYQDYAHRARAEIGRLIPAVIEVRKLIYLPVHLVILTDPDWVLTKWTDASDVILHEVQQGLFNINEPAEIDFLKVGDYYEDYATMPGSCMMNSGNRATASGICLGTDELYNSRWADKRTTPYNQVVVVHWDEMTGKLNILRNVSIRDLPNYNITTAGPTTLATNPDRVAVPLP